jgi:hypothetical protein
MAQKLRSEVRVIRGRDDQQNKYLRQRSSERPIILMICRLV